VTPHSVLLQLTCSQLPPVVGAKLYEATSARPTADGDNMAPTVQGRRLWERVNCVVMLDQQMRQQGDEPYMRMLQHLRDGKLNPEDLKLIHSLIVPTGQRLSEEWQQARLGVARNPTRSAINNHHILSEGARLHQQVLISVAFDQSLEGDQERPILSKTKRLKLLRVPDNKTKNLPSYLPLLVGQKYILKNNEATDFGIVNGAECVLEQVLLDPREPPLSSAAVHYLQYVPIGLILRFPNSKLDKPLTGLKDAKLFPLLPVREACSAQVYRQQISFSRYHFKLIPARGVTCHGVQGKTLDRFIVNLDISFSETPETAPTCFCPE
jgi:hypothetical protein